MIISRTPLRVSFVGGGTDIPVFYRKFGGAVISTAINRFVYVTVTKKFDERLRLSYSKTEDVLSTGEISHPLARAILQKLEIDGGLEITSIADIPSHGTGLGSSSAFCVGLLNALHAYLGRYVGRQELGAEACEVEIDILREPIGKQDQYASACGGLNYIRFNPDETIELIPLTHMRSLVHEIQRRLLVFYTGVTRSASGILAQQQANMTGNSENEASLRHMLELVEHVRCEFEKNNALALGEVLHECWMIKRRLAKGITSEEIDNWYNRARTAGAIGGKILGAGGGGFLLIFAPPDRHEAVIRALPELRRVKLGFDRIGTAIIFSEPNQYELDQDEVQHSH